MNEYLIALGSNMGDRKYYIEKAVEAIDRTCGKVTQSTSPIESEAIGAADGFFLNSALICRSALDPEALLDALKTIEKQLGRTDTVRWGNRCIDCDIILWRNEHGESCSFQSPKLTIPHPEAKHRHFVLAPACSIAGSWMDPISGCQLQELLDTLCL